MFAISAIAYLDRVNISIAGGAIQQEFGLDNLRLGWVFSAFVAGYALFQAPGGRLADRFGPRNILALGTVWWAVFTALTALAPSAVGACPPDSVVGPFCARVGRGGGVSGFQPAGGGLDSISGARARERGHFRRASAPGQESLRRSSRISC